MATLSTARRSLPINIRVVVFATGAMLMALGTAMLVPALLDYADGHAD